MRHRNVINIITHRISDVPWIFQFDRRRLPSILFIYVNLARDLFADSRTAVNKF